MRVSQRQIYSNSVGYMNSSLSALMESNMEASSQKRINKPSDDPVGMARILSYRSSISKLNFNETNIKMAQGWLSQADGALADSGAGVSSVLTKILTLAQQAATGTVTAENRGQIAMQLRELFGTLINLANTQFDGKSIFAGHKTDQPAYVMGLNVSCTDPNMTNALYEVHGATQYTSLIQFTGADGPVSGQTFRYTIDGGKNWHDDGTISGTGAAGDPLVMTLPMAGQTVTMRPADGAYPFNPVASQVDVDNTSAVNNGTWMYVRPTAIYQGDTNDVPPEVKTYPATATGATASGYFTRDVAVRINPNDNSTSPPSFDPAQDFIYSYSLDDGNTWVQVAARAGSQTLNVPGGFLNLSAPLAATDANAQYIVHPLRADIEFEVSTDEYIRVNNVGKDIFGGIYRPASTPSDPAVIEAPIPAIKNGIPVASQQYGAGEGEANNMFEVVGRLIAFCETNSQHGVQQALDDLSQAQSNILTAAADVGGRENRLSTIYYITTSRIDSDAEAMSRMEDVDISELMTRLAQQQLAYNAVLKSSSMIMQMSLLNFM